MRDFDIERTALAKQRDADLRFKIGGRELKARSHVPPEVMTQFQDEPVDPSATAAVKQFDDFIIQILEPESAEVWAEIREKADPPLSLWDVEQVAFELLRVSAGRPTIAPSSSGRGRSSKKDSSEGD